MFFFPYRAELRSNHFPWTTLVVCLLCLAVFLGQKHNNRHIEQVATAYCRAQVHDTELKGLLARVYGDWNWNRFVGWILTPLDGNEACGAALADVQGSYDRDDALLWFDRALRSYANEKEEEHRVPQRFRPLYHDASYELPSALTRRLLTETPSWNPLRMITGSLAHANWEHIIFNLIFFVIFAIAVEALLGSVVFGATILFLMFGISALQNIVFIGEIGMRPSLGLSGVVMGVMALFTMLLPRAKVRFFYWFMINVGSIALPGWVVALWYIALNINGIVFDWNGGIGYGAHLSGAVLGLALGMTAFRRHRHWSGEVNAGKVQLNDPRTNWVEEDTRGFRYIEALSAAPVYLFAVYIALWLTAFGILWVILSFRFLLLWMVPGALLWWLFRRQKRAARSDHERYQEALAEVKARHWEQARTKLEALAEDGYGRAQVKLAEILMDARTGPVLPNASANWLRRAVAMGNREAMYKLAWYIVDRRIVARESNEDLRLFERALALGEPRAAMALGHLYGERRVENMDSDEVKEKRIALFESAVRLFLENKQPEDAETALRELAALDPAYPAVRDLSAKLGIDPGTGEDNHPNQWTGIMTPGESD
ncbi:MAG: rhomboid family intramembrane serine protease [Acidiferrobacteraceae bacterium]